MPSYNIEVNFEFDILCFNCGDALEVKEKVVNNTSEYRVVPCKSCSDSVYEDGYNAGEIEGNRKGYTDGYEDGEEAGRGT